LKNFSNITENEDIVTKDYVDNELDGKLSLSDDFVDNSSPEKSALGIFPSTAKTMIGSEYNILLNGDLDNRLTYTVSGSSGFTEAQLKNLTDGELSPQYAPDGVDPNDPLVLLIEGLPSTHTQTGGVIGWTSRYWYPSRYKFEVYDDYNSRGWKTLIDQSSVEKSTQNLVIPIYPNGFAGSFTKIRITIYETATSTLGANGFPRFGLSELFFHHPEAIRNFRYANAGFLNGKKDTDFLGVNQQANDADTVDGKHASDFLEVNNPSIGIMGDDTRSNDYNPDVYMSGGARYLGRATAQSEFKYCNVIGVDSIISSTYCFLMTYVPWSDGSGGYPIQMAMGEDGKLAIRTGTGNTSWGSWKEIFSTGNLDINTLALKSNVLELDNTTPFTPDNDYEPATKKYADNKFNILNGEIFFWDKYDNVEQDIINETSISWGTGSQLPYGTTVTPYFPIDFSKEYYCEYIKSGVTYTAQLDVDGNVLFLEGESDTIVVFDNDTEITIESANNTVTDIRVYHRYFSYLEEVESNNYEEYPDNGVQGDYKYIRKTKHLGVKYSTLVVGNTVNHSGNKVDFLCNGTNDQNAINSAISLLPESGGEILILEGEYSIGGTIFLKNNVKLIGIGKPLFKRGFNSDCMINGDNCSNILIKGIAFDGQSLIYTSKLNSRAISLIEDYGYEIENNRVVDCFFENNFVATIIRGSNSVFEGNIVKTAPDIPSYLMYSYTVAVKDYCIIKDNIFKRGENYESNEDVLSCGEGCVVSSNRFLDNLSISVDDNNTTVSNNIFVGYGGSYTYTNPALEVNNRCSVTGNIIYDYAVGINLSNNSDNTISGNTIVNCKTGIFAGASASRNNITSNTIKRDSYPSEHYSIYFDGTTGENNLITSNLIMGKDVTGGSTTNLKANNKYN
jgi:parallel beta-helix repeat protein